MELINRIFQQDVKQPLPLEDKSVHCCITSPPYWGLRDYGKEGQLGLEKTPEEYISNMVNVFREVKRVLRDDGTLWVNIGDSYATGTTAGRTEGKRGLGEATQIAQDAVPRIGTPAGCKTKDLVGIPWMLAFALRADGWYLRQDLIWAKPNPMPESVTDRCTKSHEYIFLLSKSQKYYYDAKSIAQPLAPKTLTTYGSEIKGYGDGSGLVMAENRANSMTVRRPKKWPVGGVKHKNLQEDGQKPNTFHQTRNSNGKEWEREDGLANKRSVWQVATKPYSDAHFATFPEDLIVDCIKAGCPENGIILDPFMGAGTTALVSAKLNRNFIGFELNEKYIKIAEKRLQKELGMFNPLRA